MSTTTTTRLRAPVGWRGTVVPCLPTFGAATGWQVRLVHRPAGSTPACMSFMLLASSDTLTAAVLPTRDAARRAKREFFAGDPRWTGVHVDDWQESPR